VGWAKRGNLGLVSYFKLSNKSQQKEIGMYEVFDSFLSKETWHTRHDFDEIRFFLCLKKVVEKPEFDPDKMGEYLQEMAGVSLEDEESSVKLAIKHYVAEAWAVKDYLTAIQL
jgi:hypothetical protein